MNSPLPPGQSPHQEHPPQYQEHPPHTPQPAAVPPEQAPPAEGTQAAENVTLDEMMRKLRENERQKDETGEMVTRSDGSTARRVRRRKRRSEQKEKKDKAETSKKSLLIRAALIVGLFLFLLMAGLFILVAFNSDSYEEKLEKRASEWVGAEVDLTAHKVLPGNITAEKMTFAWPENSHVSSLTLNKIEGGINFRSLLGARLGGQYYGGRNGTLVLNSPATPGDLMAELSPSDYPFDFSRYYCDLLDVQFGDSGQLALKGAEVSLRHFANEGFRVTVSGGGFHLKGWQDFEIHSALLRFPDGEVSIDQLRLKNPLDPAHGGVGALTIKGGIPLTQGEQAQLDLEMTDFPMSVLSGTDMGSFFTGKVRANKDGVAMYTAGNDSLDSLVLPFKGDDFSFKRFPMVENLKKIIFEDAEEELAFDTDISGVFRWSPRGSSIEKLEMANKNIRMEGGLVVSSAGKIRGKLTLWISMGFINDKPKFRNHPAFSRRGGEGNGYAIIDVQLMGTTKLPDDDFALTIGHSSINGESNQDAGKSAEDLWKQLENE